MRIALERTHLIYFKKNKRIGIIIIIIIVNIETKNIIKMIVIMIEIVLRLMDAAN